MVTSLNTRLPAREAGYEMMQYIMGRLTAITAGTAVTQRIGTIPAGAIITGIQSRIVTAFATAAGMGITLGQSGTAPADLGTGLGTLAGGTIFGGLTNITQPLTADLEVWGQITSGATAGDAYLSVWFQKPVA